MDISTLGAYADSFRAQIRDAPQNGNLHLGLGILLQSRDIKEHTGGRLHDEALAAYEAANRLGVSPDQRPSLYTNWGVLLTTMSRPKEAEVILQRGLNLLGLSPRETVQLWYYRGSAFNTAGELRSAENAFLKVLELEPQSAKAIAALAAIVKDDPKSTVTWAELQPKAVAALTHAEFELASFEEVVTITAASATTVKGLHKPPKRLNRNRGLERLSRYVTEALVPNHPDPATPLRHLLHDLIKAARPPTASSAAAAAKGGPTPAEVALAGGGTASAAAPTANAVIERANELFASVANLHFTLFHAKEYLAKQAAKKEAQDKKAQEAAAEEEGEESGASASAAEGGGGGSGGGRGGGGGGARVAATGSKPSVPGEPVLEQLSAWQHLVLGNAFEAARRPGPYNPATEESTVHTYRSVFSKGFWPFGIGSTSTVPIFVVGLMRSGSTLVETVLGSHSTVWGMGEDSVFNGQLPEIRDGVVASIGSGSLENLSHTVDGYAATVVEKMLAKVPIPKNASSPAITTVVDKMLFNFRNIGFIHLLFPNAKIIHCVRDFHDLLLSNFKYKFDDIGLEFSLRVGDLVAFFHSYREMMRHWEKVLPGRVLTVQYEHMVSAPEASMRRLLKWCNLPWEDQVRNFHQTERVVHTFSQQQVKQGMYTTSVAQASAYATQLEALLQQAPQWEGGLKQAVEVPKLKSNKHKGTASSKAKSRSLNWVTGDLLADEWQPPPQPPAPPRPPPEPTPPPVASPPPAPAPSTSGQEDGTPGGGAGTRDAPPHLHASTTTTSTHNSASLGTRSISTKGSSEAASFQAQLAALEAEKMAAVAAEEYLKAAALKDQIRALKMSPSSVVAAAAHNDNAAAPDTLLEVDSDGEVAQRKSSRPTADDLAAVIPPTRLKPLNLDTHAT